MRELVILTHLFYFSANGTYYKSILYFHKSEQFQNLLSFILAIELA